MTHSKNRWLILLLCVNILLLTAVIFSWVGLPRAYGQVRPFDYLLVSGRLDEDSEAVWIIDMGTHQLTTCRYNKTTGQIEVGQVVEIASSIPWGF
ncbi:MAG: hypothetical protein JW810_05030 [Sedimentisphaerales bacterium]|nr:hypothetical protein [Sedimentisphaerales bacterium]